jgi:hypothetical protein
MLPRKRRRKSVRTVHDIVMYVIPVADPTLELDDAT